MTTPAPNIGRTLPPGELRRVGASSSPTPGTTQAPTAPAGQDLSQLEGAPQFSSPGKPATAFGGLYGPLSNRRDRQGEFMAGGGSGGQITKSVVDMTNEFYGWSDTQKASFRNRLALMNKSFLTATDDQLAQAWGDYVQQSANYLSAEQTVTPWDIFSKDVALHGGSLGPTTKTTKTVDTNLTSRIDSDAIFKSAAQSLLGRAPTAAEYQAFYGNLNSQERANPTTSTTTTTTDAEGNVTNSQRTSEGGLGAGGAQLIAQRQAEQNPEYGAYQASTTYMNALMQTIMRGY